MGFNFSNKLRFNNAPYVPGCVYTHLEELKRYDDIIGLDFGDGVCSICRYRPKRTEQVSGITKSIWNYERVKVPDSISIADGVPTVIAYFKGKKFIGKEALEDYSEVFHQFKVLPSKWETEVDGYTHETLTRDFLGKLWELVLEENAEIKQNPEKTLVVVGHPGGKEWSEATNLNLYINLLKEVFVGYGVGVMPEPFAAVFGAILEGDALEINKGIYIIEPGSSTTDTCYILPGKKISTNSVDCAGRHIDKAVCDYLVHINKETLDLIPQFFEQKSVRKAILELKGWKEKYCNNPEPYDEGSASNEKSIILKQMDPIKKEIIPKRIDFLVNRELFDNAVNFKTDHGTWNGSWEDKTKKFLTDDKATICLNKNGEMLCDRIILSGGTSKAPHFVDAVKDVYQNEIEHHQNVKGKDLIHKSDNPTQTVAIGLAYGNFLGHRITQSRLESCIMLNLKTEFDKYAESFANCFAETILHTMKAFCDDYLGKTSANRPVISAYTTLKNELNNYIDNEGLTVLCDTIEKDIFNFFLSVQPKLKQEVTKLVNKAFQSYYEEKNNINLKKIDLTDMHSDIFRSRVTNGDSILQNVTNKYLINERYIRKCFSAYEKYAFSDILIFTPNDAFLSMNRKLSVASEYQRRLNEIKNMIKSDIENNDDDYLYNLAKEIVKIQAEIYLGKALLLITTE